MNCNIDLAEQKGLELQTTVAMEECAELIQAIAKLKRYGESLERRQHLLEEIADVELCIEQLKHFFDINENDIGFMKRYKIRREMERSKGE